MSKLSGNATIITIDDYVWDGGNGSGFGENQTSFLDIIGDYDFDVSDEVSETVINNLLLWLQVSAGLWWYTVAVSLFSALVYSAVLVYLIQKRYECRQFELMLTITVSDALMLLLMGICILIQGNLAGEGTTRVGEIICKVLMYTTNVAGFLTNWCWILLWGQRYMEVFHPFQQIHNSEWHISRVILVLFAVVAVLEGWTLFVATEHSSIGIHFCGLDTERWPMSQLKWVILIEAIISYAFPLVLILFVNIRIIHRTFLQSSLIQQQSTLRPPTSPSPSPSPPSPSMSNIYSQNGHLSSTIASPNNNILHCYEGGSPKSQQKDGSIPFPNVQYSQIKSPTNSDSPQKTIKPSYFRRRTGNEIDNIENNGADEDFMMRKIVGERVEARGRRLRVRFLLRTVLAASLDLALNLPDYAIQLVDNFTPISGIIRDYRLKLAAESSAFVLYFLQYPCILLYVHLLIQDFRQVQQSKKRRALRVTKDMIVLLESAESLRRRQYYQEKGFVNGQSQSLKAPGGGRGRFHTFIHNRGSSFLSKTTKTSSSNIPNSLSTISLPHQSHQPKRSLLPTSNPHQNN